MNRPLLTPAILRNNCTKNDRLHFLLVCLPVRRRTRSSNRYSSWCLLQFQYLPFPVEKSLLYHQNFSPFFLAPFLSPPNTTFPPSLGKSMNVSVGSSRVSRSMIQAWSNRRRRSAGVGRGGFQPERITRLRDKHPHHTSRNVLGEVSGRLSERNSDCERILWVDFYFWIFGYGGSVIKRIQFPSLY